jgi:hypothetical protein
MMARSGAGRRPPATTGTQRFTSYRVEEFWTLAERIGFRPEYVTLVPRQAEDFSGDLYAYYAMLRPLT